MCMSQDDLRCESIKFSLELRLQLQFREARPHKDTQTGSICLPAHFLRSPEISLPEACVSLLILLTLNSPACTRRVHSCACRALAMYRRVGTRTANQESRDHSSSNNNRWLLSVSFIFIRTTTATTIMTERQQIPAAVWNSSLRGQNSSLLNSLARTLFRLLPNIIRLLELDFAAGRK